MGETSRGQCKVAIGLKERLAAMLLERATTNMGRDR